MSSPLPSGALSGVTVLDLSRLLPGPFCSMILADHGARVIMIEDRRFESESGFPRLPLRNKEHMCLNLKTKEGKAVFFALVEKADVILEGFRPGVVGKLGVDYGRVKKINPGIIYCSITGYGQTGPLKDRPGHDVNYLGESGLLSLNGEPDKPPAIPGFQVADLAGGAMNAVIGILLALYERNRSGQGQYIDISMTDGCTSLLTLALDLRQLTGQPVNRSDSALSHRYAFYNTYETEDGLFLSLGCLEFRFWKNLCTCLDRPQWIERQFDDVQRKDLIRDLRELIIKKPMAHWKTLFDAGDVCWGKVRSLDEAMESPLLKERGMALTMKNVEGEKMKTLGIPVKLSRTPGSLFTPPAVFGQDSESVLAELGYTKDDIRSFRERNII